MADSSEVRALLLQINANTELLRSNLSDAEKAVKAFHESTQQHLDDGDKRFESFGKSIEKLEGPLERLKSLSEVAVGALLGESLLEKGKQSLEFAGNIQFMANQIGVSTDYLQKFNYAAGQYGVATDVADTALTKFTRTIGEVANGNKEATDLFDRLGVKVFDSGGKVRSVESILADFSNGLKLVDNPAQRTTDTMTAFGRGAAGLTPLLQQGSAGFATLAQSAQELGIVLSPELIEHSENLNHKLAAMKQIVDAQMASVVASNAQAIEDLASALVKAAGAISKFMNAHPQAAAALLGAMGGGLVAGPAGIVVGGLGAAGLGSGEVSKQIAGSAAIRDRVANTKLPSQFGTIPGFSTMMQIAGFVAPAFYSREGLIAAAPHAPEGEKPKGEGGLGSTGAGATNNGGADLKKAQADLADLEKQKVGASGAALTAYNEEITSKKREIAFLKEGATAEMAKSLAAKQGAALTKGENDAKKAQRDAEEQRKKLVEENIQFETEQLRLQKSILDGKAHTAANDASRDALEKQIIDETAKTLAEQIAQRRDAILKDPKASEARIRAAKSNAARLLDLNEQDRQQKIAKIDIDRALQTQKDAADKAALDLQGQIDLVGLQDQLAVTRKQRLDYELKLLDLQRQAAIKEQQDIIDAEKLRHPKEADQDKNIIGNAQTKIDQIKAAAPLQSAAVKQKNADPLSAYALQLKQATEDGFGKIEVDGLQEIGDQLSADILKIHSFKSAISELGDIAEDVFKKMIEDFVKLEFEKEVVSLLPGLGLKDGGEIPGFADGGLNGLLSGPGTSRSDSILARLSTGEFIMNAASTRKFLPLLHAMNDNRVPGFADGGVVGMLSSSVKAPRISSRDIQGSRATGLHVTGAIDVQPSPLFDAKMVGVSAQVVGVAADPIMKGAQQRTTRALGRRPLPGGFSG